jgi:ketosteroid isomerase-like protein
MNTTHIDTLLERWTDAERRGDDNALDRLLADDFVGVGPVGFVLDRTTWLARFGTGLTYDDLHLDDIAVHDHEHTAIAVAHQHATGHIGDTATPPDTRVLFTLVTHADGQPRIAAMQYSFIGPALGAPA